MQYPSNQSHSLCVVSRGESDSCEHTLRFYEAVKEQQQLLLSMEDRDTVAVDAAMKRAREKLAVEVQELAAQKSM